MKSQILSCTEVKPLNTSTHASYPHSITAVIPSQHCCWLNIETMQELQKPPPAQQPCEKPRLTVNALMNQDLCCWMSLKTPEASTIKQLGGDLPACLPVPTPKLMQHFLHVPGHTHRLMHVGSLSSMAGWHSEGMGRNEY